MRRSIKGNVSFIFLLCGSPAAETYVQTFRKEKKTTVTDKTVKGQSHLSGQVEPLVRLGFLTT